MIEGFSPVPEAPGLGFEVDEDAIARFASGTPLTTGQNHRHSVPARWSQVLHALAPMECRKVDRSMRKVRYGELISRNGKTTVRQNLNRIYERVEREGSFKVDRNRREKMKVLITRCRRCRWFNARERV